MVERMAREGQSFHEPAKARAEVRPVLLYAERELHQLHLAVARTAAVARDDGHFVAAARKRAAGFPAIGLQSSRNEARRDVVEADSHGAAATAVLIRPALDAEAGRHTSLRIARIPDPSRRRAPRVRAASGQRFPVPRATRHSAE